MILRTGIGFFPSFTRPTQREELQTIEQYLWLTRCILTTISLIQRGLVKKMLKIRTWRKQRNWYELTKPLNFFDNETYSLKCRLFEIVSMVQLLCDLRYILILLYDGIDTIMSSVFDSSMYSVTYRGQCVQFRFIVESCLIRVHKLDISKIECFFFFILVHTTL